MSRRKIKSPRTYSMYPNLHSSVSDLLKSTGLMFTFHNGDTDRNCIEQYDTSIMGRFSCHNHNCTTKGWSSKKVAITIRMYPGDKYNARVYHQRCRQCKWVSRPGLDRSYAERIVYRLKKWNGVDVETPYYDGESKGPHNRNLCEGCKAGHCEG
ncbi:zinc-binding domain-containing protein [Aspergillus varians]